jgi:hypothetical protein
MTQSSLTYRKSATVNNLQTGGCIDKPTNAGLVYAEAA